jgi:hypothetical protein
MTPPALPETALVLASCASKPANTAAAKSALAKGIAAQRNGRLVEALSCYYEAAKLDPDLAEAASRSAALSRDIREDTIGQNGAQPAEALWVKILQEAAAFFREHPPLELVYDPASITSRIDYAAETAELSFQVKLIGTTGLGIIHDLDQGLQKTRGSEDWGIGVDTIYDAIPDRYEFNAALVNEEGETIGAARRVFEKIAVSDDIGGFDANFSHHDAAIVFSGVKAGKTSGKLAVSIVSVNGMDAKTAGKQGYMRISPGDFTGLDDPSFQFGWRFGNLAITGYRGTNKDVIIPSKITWGPVTSIGFRAFAYNQLTSVALPNSLTSIGDGAFAYNQLTSLTLPDSLTSIGEEAFWENQLTSLTLPDSLTSIGEEAFGSNQLTSVTLPDSLTSIEILAFAYNQLTSVALPDSLTTIGNRAIYKNQLTSVALPDSLTSIGDLAFGRNRLTSVTLPNSLTSIGDYAFLYNQLTSVALPDSLTSIGNLAFAANQLTSVALPANVSLGKNALPCQEAYLANDKKAGAYLYVRRKWTYRQ